MSVYDPRSGVLFDDAGTIWRARPRMSGLHGVLLSERRRPGLSDSDFFYGYGTGGGIPIDWGSGGGGGSSSGGGDSGDDGGGVDWDAIGKYSLSALQSILQYKNASQRGAAYYPAGTSTSAGGGVTARVSSPLGGGGFTISPTALAVGALVVFAVFASKK